MVAYPGVAQIRYRPHRDVSWQAKAVCVNANPELFSACETNPDAVMDAKRICHRCPVIAECLAHALATKETGIWGATTASERGLMKCRPPKPRRKSCASCGGEVSGHGRSRYCSKACSRKRSCQDCGVEFASGHRSRFCSRCRQLRRTPKEYASAVNS